MKKVMIVFFLAFVFCIVGFNVVNAAWTPLVTAADFTGMQTDTLTVASGVIGVMVIVVGIGILIRAMTH